MKHRILKKWTSIVLVALMVISMLPAIAITTSAAEFTGTFEKHTGELVEGDYVITYGTYSLGNTIASSRFSNGATFTVSNDAITNPDSAIVWHIAPTSDGTAWTIYNAAASSYAAGTGAKNKGQLLADATDTKAQWTVTANSDGTYDFVNVANAAADVNKTLRQNGTYGWACYATSTGGALTLYKLQEAAHEHSYAWNNEVGADGCHTLTCANTDGKCDALTTTEECTWKDGSCSVCGAAAPECAHANTTEVAEVPATCTEVGYTAGVQCNDCTAFISGREEIAALGHTEEIDAAVDAKCTETGLTEGKHCSVCNEVLVKQDEIPALGHNYINGTCSVCEEPEPVIPEYVLTDLADIKADMTVIIVATKGTNNWAMSNDNGTSDAPSAVVVTVDGNTISTDATNILWNIVNDNGNLTIYPAGQTEKYLYCTNTNNGIRVGTTTAGVGTFTMGSDGYLTVATSTTRYLGVYETTPDWRCYTNTTGNTANQTFAFYVLSTDLPCEHSWVDDGEPTPATCTEDGSQPQKCEKCGETQSVTLPATGHTDVDPVDSKCDTCGTNLCTEHVWVDNDEVITAPTCSATGLIGQHCSVCNEPNPTDRVLDKIDHTPETDAAVAPTCTATGLTEGSHCSVCDEVLTAQEVVDMVDHNYVDNKCTMCGDIIVTGSQLADFQFGENGDASHKDGAVGDLEATYTTNGYTLTPENATNVYGGAFDAKGNSALKLGTGSKAASFSFTVPSNCNTVVLYIAGYKAEAAKVNVNGTPYEITSQSNEGAYTKIVVDTKSNKTVTLTTLSGGYRAMIDSIEFWGEEPKVNSMSLNLNEGVTIKVTYTIPQTLFNANEGAKIIFGGKEMTANAGTNVYEITLTPGNINKAITIGLYDAQGAVIGTKIDVSVATYAARVEAVGYTGMNMSQAKYGALLDLLQAVQNYGTVASGKNVTELSTPNDTSYSNKTTVFTEFGGTLEESISIRLTVDTAAMADKTFTVTIKGDGEPTTIIENQSIESYVKTIDGKNYVVITGLYALNFNDTITITVSDGTEAIFTFNAYLTELYKQSDYSALAAAAYSYGALAEAYKAAQ